MVCRNVLELIGRTPLVELSAKTNATGARILLKVESANPGGSAKDRVGLAMIEAAERDGRLKPGATIIEPTSGNTGVGLALASAVKGYRLILVMPETMSIERRRLAAAYGAEVVLTPGAEGMRGSLAKAAELNRTIPGSFIPQQFSNPANAAVHEATTGPEIWAAAEGKVDAFVAGVGTGGTLTGVGRFLRKENPRVGLYAVEPASSPLLSKGVAGPHGIQGIGANFVPEVLDRSLITEVLPVADGDAFEMARTLGRREGLLVGISSGAAVHAALGLASRPGWSGRTVVVMLPDTGERYLSTGLFA